MRPTWLTGVVEIFYWLMTDSFMTSLYFIEALKDQYGVLRTIEHCNLSALLSTTFTWSHKVTAPYLNLRLCKHEDVLDDDFISFASDYYIFKFKGDITLKADYQWDVTRRKEEKSFHLMLWSELIKYSQIQDISAPSVFTVKWYALTTHSTFPHHQYPAETWSESGVPLAVTPSPHFFHLSLCFFLAPFFPSISIPPIFHPPCLLSPSYQVLGSAWQSPTLSN